MSSHNFDTPSEGRWAALVGPLGLSAPAAVAVEGAEGRAGGGESVAEVAIELVELLVAGGQVVVAAAVVVELALEAGVVQEFHPH